MALPTPDIPVFVAGSGPLASTMNTLVQQPLQFCTDSVVTRLEQQSSQSVSANTLTLMNFTVLEDPYSCWNAGLQAFLAPFNGYYEAILTVGLNTVNGTVAASLLISSVTQFTLCEIATPSTNQGYATCSFIVPMIGGLDIIQAQAFASAATTTSTAIGLRTSMEIKFIST